MPLTITLRAVSRSTPWRFIRSDAVGDDGVDVLLDLQILVMVFLAEAHAFADDLQNVHDLERPVALVRAQFAVVGMIDRDQRIDAGRARGLELLELQLGLELRQGGEVDALQADRRHVELDDLDAGHREQQLLGRLHHAGDARMAVQRHRHLDAVLQERPELVELAMQERHERRHVERLRAGRALDGRQHGLAELHDAARAPRQHLLGLRLRQLLDGVVGEAAERVDVAGAKLARCRSNGSARPSPDSRCRSCP